MSNEVGTARTYALIGFIFYLIAFIVGIVAILGTMVFMFVPVMMDGPRNIALIPLVLFIPGIIFAVLSWITVKDIDAGKYSEARTYSLVLGILGLFFGWLIGGIFFLLAYVKLGEIIRQPTIQQSQKFCVQCGKPVLTDAKYCSHCGKELPIA